VFQTTAEPGTVSIANMSFSRDIPDEPIQNGGDSIEEIIERWVSVIAFAERIHEEYENTSGARGVFAM